MVAESESALLRRFVGGDAGAFAEIVRRYAGLVYTTCVRVLSDTDKAADATQETFFQLTKKAGEIKGSLAGWLHRVAVRKAVDLIRSDSARRQRERRYLDARSDEDQTWQEVSPYVDEALNGLDEQTRELLVCHYLQGRSMTELAAEQGISRPTVSRQIESGLTRLRAQLHRRGILVTAAGLSVLLTENTALSAPAALLQQLGKIGLVGTGATAVVTGGSASHSILAGGLVASAKTKLVVAAAAAVVVGATVVTYRSLSRGPQPPTAAPAGNADDRRTARPQQSTPSVPAAPNETDEQAEERNVPRPTATEKTVPPAQVTGRQEPIPPPAPTPWQSEPAEPSGYQLDLSSPEATVRSFTRAMASGDADSAMACFLPGGIDYEDMQEILFADPDDPAQRDEYEMKLWFESLDADADVLVLSVEETERGTSVVWRVTFKSSVTIPGHTFSAGDTFDLDGTLQKSGDSWLIDGI